MDFIMKNNLAIIGMQWGDEGKGKIVDLLAPHFDIVARFQGGNNAGHTVKFEGSTFILHMIPSGIFRPAIINIVGNGVAVNPEALIEEMDALKKLGVRFDGRLFISERSHLIMPYHLYRDKSSEESLGKRKIGTTSKGIGPTYGDKALRMGIRACMLVSDSYLDYINELLEANIRRIELLYQAKPMDINDILNKFESWRAALRPFIADTSLLLFNSIKEGKKVLFEGAQGTMLDIDFGTYPYVTSSSSSAAGVTTGLGIGPSTVGSVLGITKAYCTRVGEGPFPTELKDKEGEILRERGREYGATTGRPRRCGWFDLVVARYAVRVNGLHHVAITKLDVLDEFENVKVCTGYRFNGDLIKDFPADLKILENLKPVYTEFKGWKQTTAGLKKFDDLPVEAQRYLKALEEMMECPIAVISTGASREDSIFLSEDFSIS